MTTCVRTLLTILVATLLHACATHGGTSGVTGNENGSTPVNESETNEYKKAIVRCYKTGGTRIVKIMGQLKCY